MKIYKKIVFVLLILVLAAGIVACHKDSGNTGESRQENTVTEEPSSEEEQQETSIPPEVTAVLLEQVEEKQNPGLTMYTEADEEQWYPLYAEFLQDSFDVISALWPDGISGVGFADLDLDGMPEMLLFDMGASASMGVQLFDIKDENVVCVSSVNEAAAAAFGSKYFTPFYVCANYFEDFRLVNDGEQTYFIVLSSNASENETWQECIRFRCDSDEILSLESVYRYEGQNGENSEFYSVDGEEVEKKSFEERQKDVNAMTDLNYDVFGVFLWKDRENYDTSMEGLLSMAEDARKGYVSIQ